MIIAVIVVVAGLLCAILCAVIAYHCLKYVAYMDGRRCASSERHAGDAESDTARLLSAERERAWRDGYDARVKELTNSPQQ